MEFTVHTTVDSNTINYFSYMYNNYNKQKSCNDNISFKIYCLDIRVYELFNNNNNCFYIGQHAGSIGHAKSIEVIQKNFNSNSINILADTDTVMLQKNWTATLNSLFDERNLDLIGGTYENIGGFSSGDSLQQTYKNIPSLSWVAFRKNLTVNFDAMPDKANLLSIDNEHLSKIYNLPIGYKLFKDVAWSLPQYIYDNNLKHLALFNASSFEKSIAIKTQNTSEEFQLFGKPFIGHQRSSMRQQFRKPPISDKFYNACEAYINSQENNN